MAVYRQPTGAERASIPPLQPFKSDLGREQSWRNWKQDFLDYFCLCKFSVEPTDRQLAFFRHVCGKELKDIYRDRFRTITERPSTLESTLEFFDIYFLGYPEKHSYRLLYL
ncbi:uncharacterized protein LOC117167217 isoform X1 [Belonocnema kinseyi]|uniref:uncharacterized protein LOC117167217 isoform X1 n=1 Tax=Belonocnema kinseyi TaxID=2817044 RepID=UPI00143D0730|nr:uncharacterized protein LOC117167217 isoform X1 [Belonocnema kinseyi]